MKDVDDHVTFGEFMDLFGPSLEGWLDCFGKMMMLSVVKIITQYLREKDISWRDTALFQE